MSSLEEQIFFGSRQLALDSYLKARQQQNDASDDPRKRGRIYPNVLDDISYQKSFERHDFHSVEKFQYPIRQPSIIINNSDYRPLSNTFFISINEVKFKSPAVKEGSCIEIKCQLGDMTVTELAFYNENTPIFIQDYFKLSLVQQSVERYFQAARANCLKIELTAKNYQYDNKIGSCFLPIETLVLLIQELHYSKQEHINKPTKLRLLSNRRQSQQADAVLSFQLILSKNPPQDKPTQHPQILSKRVVEKQKIMVSVISVSMRQGNPRIQIDYKGVKHPISEKSNFTVQVDKNNLTLNRGLELSIILDDQAKGQINIPVIHLFLNEAAKGKYPVIHRITSEYLGCLELQLSEPVIVAAKQLKEAHATQPNRTNISKGNSLKNTGNFMRSIVISINEVLYLSQEDVTHRRFYLICYKNQQIKTSAIIKFKSAGQPRLYVSDHTIDFDFLSESLNSNSTQISLELYEKGLEFDSIIAYSKIDVDIPIFESLVVEDISVDCSPSDKQSIMKATISVAALTYYEGYFVEDKIDRLLQLFHSKIRDRLSKQVGQTEVDIKQTLKNQLGITYGEIDRLCALTKSTNSLKQNASITQILSRKIHNSPIFTINSEDLYNVMHKIIQELEYTDYQRTGYLTQEQLTTILGYFNVIVPLANYAQSESTILKDAVYNSRGFRKDRMISYLPLIRDSQQTKKIKDPVHTTFERLAEKIELPQSAFRNIQVLILRAVNLNTLSESIKSPNSYMVEEETGKSTQVSYRNANPEYLCEMLIEQPKTQFLRFKIMHKDFKTKDSLIAEFTVNLTSLLSSTGPMKILLGDTAYVQLQNK